MSDLIDKISEKLYAVERDVADLKCQQTKDSTPATPIKARMDRLFGTDMPGHQGLFTQRPFYVDAMASNILGFESTTNPYPVSSPFSWAVVPTDGSLARNAAAYPSWLRMFSGGGTAGNLTLRWSSATAKNFLNAIVNFAPVGTTADYHAYEFRVWDVQTPTATDKYWAFRVMWKPGTYPQSPLYGRLYSGTGVTYSETDGTAQSAIIPLVPGAALRFMLGAYAGPYGAFRVGMADGMLGVDLGVIVAGWPAQFKCADISVVSRSYQNLYIDDVWIT